MSLGKESVLCLLPLEEEQLLWRHLQFMRISELASSVLLCGTSYLSELLNILTYSLLPTMIDNIPREDMYKVCSMFTKSKVIRPCMFTRSKRWVQKFTNWNLVQSMWCALCAIDCFKRYHTLEDL